MIKDMKPFMEKINYLKRWPNKSFKRAYGILKKHKPGEPLRPIVSSVNSITSGVESYLLKLLANELLKTQPYQL